MELLRSTSSQSMPEPEMPAERISRLNYELTLLPELPGPAPSREARARAAAVRAEVARLFAAAEGDTAHPKWSHISRYARTVAGRGEMRSAVRSGVARSGRKTAAGERKKAMVLVLPETEEEWARLERRGRKRKRGAEARVPVVAASRLSDVEEKVLRWQEGMKNIMAAGGSGPERTQTHGPVEVPTPPDIDINEVSKDVRPSGLFHERR